MYAWPRIASAAPIPEDSRDSIAQCASGRAPADNAWPEVLTPLRGLGSIMRFERGAVIYRERDHASAMYRVVSGVVALSRTAESRRRIVDFRFAGEFFGAIHRPEYTMRAEATADSVLLSYPRGYVDTMFDELPQFRRTISGLLAEPGQRSDDTAESQTARERIMDFLLSLSGRISGSDESSLPFSCDDIADRLDLSSVAVDCALRAIESRTPQSAEQQN
jgi:CRP-like cAMP-binding protein